MSPTGLRYAVCRLANIPNAPQKGPNRSDLGAPGDHDDPPLSLTDAPARLIMMTATKIIRTKKYGGYLEIPPKGGA